MAEQSYDYDQYAPQTSGRLFSSSMFGFNKEEVLEYLDELADENYQRQERAEQQIADLNQTVQNLQATVANVQQAGCGQEAGAFGEQLEVARAATQQAEEELAELREQLGNAQQENEWFRHEYQRADDHIAALQRQLDGGAAGRAEGEQPSQKLADAEKRLAEKDALLLEKEKTLSESRARLAELGVQLDKAKLDVQAAQSLPEKAAADAIIADANAEAERIRTVARDEKERIRRQIRTSAGGIAESITNLRGELGGVEGNVVQVLQSVQSALADVSIALNRTEQNLNTLGVQVERFPAPSTPAAKPQQVVYFQPAERQELNGYSSAAHKVPAAESYGQGGFRRIEPGQEAIADGSRPFRAAYSNSGAKRAAYWPQAAEAYPETAPNDERMRMLAETLVETLVKMMR